MSQVPVIDTCQFCTFTNERGAKICIACGRTLGLPVVNLSSSDGVKCSQCTYQNLFGCKQCVICEMPIVTVEQVNMSSTLNNGQLCQICFSTTTKEFKMPGCTHSFCVSCSKQYFTVKIMECGINNFRCPIDGCFSFDELPNKLDFFKDLKLVLDGILDVRTQKMFDNKTGILDIMHDPGFVRCSLCGHGFINQCKSKQTNCSACLQSFCNRCGRQWTRNHSQTDCKPNDKGMEDGVLQMYTNATCPQCKYKYILERGGCMHITCTQCSYEYCEFCFKKMTGKGKACNFPNCSMEKSLHGHHPRNCMYYIREMNHTNLEELLKANGVRYNLVQKEKTSTCTVQVNKDISGTWVASECNHPSAERYNNMCLEHYKWYLGELMKIHSIDPVGVMNNLECMCELKRNNVPLQYIESYGQPIEDTHTAGLRTLIRENIPYEKLL
ncbi:E3 ubiquitin-protein ligase RNF31-like isoform X2 [Bradysia coprophila]|uniref:E3 ubiquitin-protein ligase RNF31-like isoform X2 n=1 Tax=Bradysia coprophila TaxID=38358 RepID=UPI00187D9F13|nr:E3 ubiquitin-protein ligase RNF31-like isoform X2 [Bradysia coprophila]